MTNVHLTLQGTWAVCRAVQRECPRAYHLPNTTLSAARKLPRAFLQQLFGPYGGEPNFTDLIGSRYWALPTDAEIPAAAGHRYATVGLQGPMMGADGRWVYIIPHRDYDEPAVLRADGQMEWWQYGQLHRDHDRPAVVQADGSQIWFRHGRPYQI